MAAYNMRGLNVYITDIRAAANKEAETKRVQKELAHIRKQFKTSKNLAGYHGKKYVAKLLYTHVLGHEVDFGHIQAVDLLSAKSYSEKAIGYMALSVLISESDELARLIIQAIRSDLMSRNEMHQCLALGAIATIGGQEMAQALLSDVQKLLVSSGTVSYVRKRAALALLRLYRKYPEIITADSWGDRAVGLLDDFDLGVITSVLSLLLGLVSADPEGYKGVVPKAVWALNKLVVSREYSSDYVYYGIPSPWIQIKLLRILQYYPVPDDSALRRRLTDVLRKIIGKGGPDSGKHNGNHNNARYAVLFEAINLVIHLDCDADLVRDASSLLGRFISARETNIRYLGLEGMSKMAILPDSLSVLRKHQRTVISALKEADISIRRRALDVLYEMCDESNSQEIVHELLGYLVTADYGIRSELVLKIAILSEKYATDLNWYVDVILQLINLAGEYVSDDIWHRVIQIVTNHEDLQKYAAETCFSHLSHPAAHEAAIKVGGYVLGEFGHLISDTEASSPKAQFDLLKSKLETASAPTRALLLSAFAKMANVYPELKGKVQSIFKSHSNELDAEVQQRSCEFFVLTEEDQSSVLETVMDIMPAFPERESSVLKKMKAQQNATADKPAWHGKEKALEAESAGDSLPNSPAMENGGGRRSHFHGTSPDATPVQERSRDRRRSRSRSRSRSRDRGGSSSAAAAPDLLDLGDGGSTQPAIDLGEPAPKQEAQGVLAELADLGLAPSSASTGGGQPQLNTDPSSTPLQNPATPALIYILLWFRR